MVWVDNMGETVSLEKLFSRPDISLGSIPGIFSTVLPTPAEMADPIMSKISKVRYKKGCDHMVKSVKISQMLVRTILPGMLTLSKPSQRDLHR